MLCKRPYMQGILPYGCGQCLPCRINRRRLWASRLMLESAKHANSSFLTLTYSDEFLPSSGSLNPKHVQDWLKRFRRALGEQRVRFYLVGEYGELTFRPHYHVAMFGYSSCLNWCDSDDFSVAQRSRCLCVQCSLVRSTWKFGKTDCGTLSEDSAQYIAGYVTKKMTSKEDVRLGGRYPEFARMSNRPGIGALAVPDIASVLTSNFGVISVANSRDVPRALKCGKKSVPLGKYLRSKLREKIASEKGVEIIKREGQANFALEMRALLEGSRSDQVSEGFKSAAEIIVENSEQKVLNLESRFKIYSKKGRV